MRVVRKSGTTSSVPSFGRRSEQRNYRCIKRAAKLLIIKRDYNGITFFIITNNSYQPLVTMDCEKSSVSTFPHASDLVAAGKLYNHNMFKHLLEIMAPMVSKAQLNPRASLKKFNDILRTNPLMIGFGHFTDKLNKTGHSSQ